jgi:hypothetical protein
VNAGPIAPLTAKDLTFAVKNYDFTGLTADQLSPLPQLEAVMDSNALDLAASIADQAVLIASMASDIADLGQVLNEVSFVDFSPIYADLAGIASAGDGMLNDFGSLIG